MEYCGGGSLQDIYHGNDSASHCIFIFNNVHFFSVVLISRNRFLLPVTGPLSESQIAYMSRETLQVTYRSYFLTFVYLHLCVLKTNALLISTSISLNYSSLKENPFKMSDQFNLQLFKHGNMLIVTI